MNTNVDRDASPRGKACDCARANLFRLHQGAPEGICADQGSGPFAVFMNSGEFLRELVGRVRPLASGADTPVAAFGN